MEGGGILTEGEITGALIEVEGPTGDYIDRSKLERTTCTSKDDEQAQPVK